MNLKFLSNRGLSELRSNIVSNSDAYLGGRTAGILSSIEGAVLESRIEAAAPPPLAMPQDGNLRDADNVRRVFQWLPRLTPVQASDSRLWTYLTHGPYSAYTATRWPIQADAKVGDRIKERYFMEGEGLSSLVRNSIARLWWFGYLTLDQNAPDKFELTDVMLSLQDLQVAFLERAIGRSPQILRGALLLWKKLITDRPHLSNQGKIVQTWAKLIRLHGGVVLLDALPEKQLQSLLWLKLSDAVEEKLPDLAEAAGDL